jgi:hypothetical protein
MSSSNEHGRQYANGSAYRAGFAYIHSLCFSSLLPNAVTRENHVPATSTGLVGNVDATSQGNSQASGYKRVYPTGPITCLQYMDGLASGICLRILQSLDENARPSCCMSLRKGYGVRHGPSVMLLDCLWPPGFILGQFSLPFDLFPSMQEDKCILYPSPKRQSEYAAVQHDGP